MNTGPILELKGITKRFPGVVANDGVDLTLEPGEVLGVLGENGAGKSTLMNLISGLDAPDEGQIILAGEPVVFGSCRDAIDRGIGMVHQHFMLVPTLSVLENIVLGDRNSGAGRGARRIAAERIRDLGARLGLEVDTDARVGDLGVGEQQRVEILKALFRDTRILILDEPTAVLSRAESRGLFETIRSLAGSGVGVILISHKLDDVIEVCDRVVVMRQGRVVGTQHVSEVTREGLVQMMVGENVSAPQRTDRKTGDRIFEVRDLAVARDNGSIALKDVRFELRAGEILALAGVEGNGQRELVETLAGMRRPAAGHIDFSIDHGAHSTVRQIRRLGVSHIPENRGETGILAPLSLIENFLLSHLFRPAFNRCGLIRRDTAARTVEQLVETYEIRTTGPDAPIHTLSGGNQQKMVLARELSGAPTVLLAAHPTRGLDVRTIAVVQRELLDRRNNGMAILLISSDLGEIWQIADRVMVAFGGGLVGPVSVDEVDLHQVAGWMSGH